MDGFAFVPESALQIGGRAVPADVKSAIMSITSKTGLDGVDQAVIVLANDMLQWLDNDLFRVGKELSLDLGTADHGLKRVFTGEIVAKAAKFTAETGNTLVVTAQDRRHNMADGTKTRWFAIPVPATGNFPFPDPATASLATLENFMLPIIDPVGAAIAVVLGGLDVAAVFSDPAAGQKLIRKQGDESDLDFLKRIAKENQWDMLVEHDRVDGHVLRFQSSLDHLSSEADFEFGLDVLEFESRITKVGQIDAVSIAVWVPKIKMTFTITLGWDWDQPALTLDIVPGVIPIGAGGKGKLKIDEPASPFSAGRKLLSELIPRLNRRMTAMLKIPGHVGLKAGRTINMSGVGKEFGGLYRITGLTHKLDGTGFTTMAELRKEIWFGSVPGYENGTSPVRPAAI